MARSKVGHRGARAVGALVGLVALSLSGAGCGGDNDGASGASGAAFASGGSAGKGGSSGQAGQAGSKGGASGQGGSAGSKGGAAGQGGAGGSSGKAGQGGQAGSGGSSGKGGGAGGCSTAPASLCGDVTAAGVCAAPDLVRYCVSPPPGECSPAFLQQHTCKPDEACVVEGGVAFCKPKGVCVPKDTLCGEGNTLLVCKDDGSGYDEQVCVAGTCHAPPGEPAQCLIVSGGSGFEATLKGCVTFEYRAMTKTGPSPTVEINVAYLALVSVHNGDKFIGSTTTGPDGCFSMTLLDDPTADTTVEVLPIAYDPATQQPALGVAKVTGATTQPFESTEYWRWSNKTEGCGEGIKAEVIVDPTGLNDNKMGKVDHNGDGKPDMLIPESCGSGAMQIYNWVRYATYRVGDPDAGLAATKGVPAQSLAVLWSPGVAFDCGACFLGKQSGGAKVTPAGSVPDEYETVMLLSGTNGSPKQWATSVLAHESGHWAMSSYSKMPGEGGAHGLAQLSKPGLAYAEGWATAFSQFLTSDPDAEVFPLYVDTQNFTTFWVDLSAGTWNQGALPLPDPQGPLDQDVNENVVAGMITRLWQAKGPDGADGYRGLGAEKIFTALRSARLTSGLNRGYKTLDLLDFFDAALCEKVATDDDVSAVSATASYPWDSSPLCQP